MSKSPCALASAPFSSLQEDRKRQDPEVQLSLAVLDSLSAKFFAERIPVEAPSQLWTFVVRLPQRGHAFPRGFAHLIGQKGCLLTDDASKKTGVFQLLHGEPSVPVCTCRRERSIVGARPRKHSHLPTLTRTVVSCYQHLINHDTTICTLGCSPDFRIGGLLPVCEHGCLDLESKTVQIAGPEIEGPDEVDAPEAVEFSATFRHSAKYAEKPGAGAAGRSEDHGETLELGFGGLRHAPVLSHCTRPAITGDCDANGESVSS